MEVKWATPDLYSTESWLSFAQKKEKEKEKDSNYVVYLHNTQDAQTLHKCYNLSVKLLDSILVNPKNTNQFCWRQFHSRLINQANGVS